MTDTLTVESGTSRYPIHVGNDLLSDQEGLRAAAPGPSVLIVTDEHVAPLYLARVRAAFDDRPVSTVILPAGEAHKTLTRFQHIIDTLIDAGFGRDTVLLALGGGIVGDMTGFAAACYLRGVAFVQLPTTLLAQVDASVGGKTGVNHPLGKNLIGAFHQPRAVICDTTTLQTLPEREFRAGLAEVIKYGAALDAGFFAWLEGNMTSLLSHDEEALRTAIVRCCTLKADIVARDTREQGCRALLNFGHTAGHAIEQVTGYTDWLHGEAVALGMLVAAELSHRLGRIDAEAVTRIRALVDAAGLTSAIPALGGAAIRAAMARDKKVAAGQLRLVLLDAIGASTVTAEFDAGVLDAVLADVFGGD